VGYDVFISYSSKDKHIADAVCNVLESEGIRCWIAPRDIRPGADWGESIIDAIYHAKTFVLVFSENANTSVQIKREVERAVNKGIPVIPFRVQDVMPAKSLEYFLSTPHWLDAFTPPMERHIRYLADTIKGILSNSPVSSSAPLKSAPPPAAAGLQLKIWQLGVGVLAVALLAGASAFLLPGLFSPHQQTVVNVSGYTDRTGRLGSLQQETAKPRNGSDQGNVAGGPDQTPQSGQTRSSGQSDGTQTRQTKP
jgi:hypothetical protein